MSIPTKSLKKRRMHPNSLANLKLARPFQPGNNANPNGRPHQADCLISCIKDELAAMSPNGKSTNEQLIASVLVAKGTGGDMRAIELLAAYTTPKPTASMALVDAEGKSLPQPSFFFMMPDGTQKTAGYVKDFETGHAGLPPGVDNNKQ